LINVFVSDDYRMSVQCPFCLPSRLINNKTMKSINKTLIAIGLVAVSGAFLTSCNKTVTSGKVDGNWDVTSGAMNESWSTEDYSETTSSTFNGSTVSSTTTIKDGNDTDTDGSTTNMTISYTFDKKTGDYTTTRVQTTNEIDMYATYYVYNDSSDTYDYEGTFERVSARTSTITEAGLFTVTGDAGDDIEKNSQIVFHMMSMDEDFNEEYSYFDETSGDELYRVDIYEAEYNFNTGETDYNRPESSDEGAESITGSSSSSLIWTVTELDKETMTVEWSDETNYVDEKENDNNYQSSSSGSWTLTAK